MIYKEFNKESHAANDKPSKDLVIKFLKSKGLDAIENPTITTYSQNAAIVDGLCRAVA